MDIKVNIPPIQLWIDNAGEMVVTNHKTGDECRVKFEPFSYFGGGTPKKVSGRVVSKEGAARFVVEGTWDAKVQSVCMTGMTFFPDIPFGPDVFVRTGPWEGAVHMT